MKAIRKSLDLLLDMIFSTMSEDEFTLFLTIFKSKIEESLNELKSTVPSGEINNKE